METLGTGDMRKRTKVSRFSLLLLALIQTIRCTSAPPLSYLTRPENVSVAVGEAAAFRCGVPESSPSVTFHFYGSHGSYSITCPHGQVEDVPQALYGSCSLKNGELMASWTLKGTSLSDNGTRVTCQGSKGAEAPAAILLVYDNGTSFSILIGCVIGGFFGTLLVAGLAFIMLQNSESVNSFFRGTQTEQDLTTIVTKDQDES
ncbi:unnamed protein product [Tetraodon nigroviridis]|uniref:(spotted green pufferfish) hypothetical protein n=1 Tax=Tetraodon nigroviridis TaxID=99883 RepID=Q4RFG1_TETNG|nr:unnamed protein product [Tetraodon nigroviridis]